MTAIQYFETLLENNWTPSISGREVEVPKPKIWRESSAKQRKLNLDQHDVLILRDGGVTEISPQSFAWHEERVVSIVTVDMRTTGEAGDVPGRERLWGYRGKGSLAENEAESYGGLQGEVKRIIDTVRKGEHEFDLIIADSQNDLSGEMGGQVWRGTTEVTLDVRASQINP